LKAPTYGAFLIASEFFLGIAKKQAMFKKPLGAFLFCEIIYGIILDIKAV
jgi:hypothetical protein